MLKKLASQTAVYGLTTIIGRFLNYLLTPIHSSVFEPAEFGVVTELYAYIVFLNVIYTYGMETAYFRFSTKTTEQGGNTAYSTALNMLFFTSLIFSTTIYIFSQPIADFLNYPDRAKLIQWIALILFLDNVVAIPFARIRLLRKVYLFAGAKLTSIFLNILLNIFFLYICPLALAGERFEFLVPYIRWIFERYSGIDFVFIANLLSNLAFLPFLIPAFRGITFKINFKQAKEMFQYGWPILILGLGGTLNEVFSRIMLKDILPSDFYPGYSKEAALGVFGACYKMSVFMSLAIQAFKFAAEPFFFSNAQDKAAPHLFARVMKYFVIVCGTILILVLANKWWLADILIRREEYKMGLDIVAPLMLANIFMGIYYNLSVWYKLTDRTIWGTYITLIGTAITIILNFVLIPILGFQGAVLSSVACYFAMAFISFIVGQKYFPIPYPVLSIIFILIVAYAIGYYIDYKLVDSFSKFIYGNIVAILYFGTIILFDKKLVK
jgi:O-antigen/teichoic acid export membrane protein